MRTKAVELCDWAGVFPVPSLCRNHDPLRSINWAENDKLLGHMATGGLTNFLYGGNAFLYHITLAEYDDLLGWLNQQDERLWMIPSAGPSYGRLIDQAPLLKKYSFPAVMHLPCGDPRDAGGLEAGLTDFCQAIGTPLILYVKEENNFGSDRIAGIEAIARMARSGVCCAIKYAVVRPDPSQDTYLEELLRRVDRNIVISGIGERPAIAHLQHFGLPGYTTGSGCIGAALTRQMFECCQAGHWEQASEIRSRFIPLEDLRDANGPARVLHAAVEAAGISVTGPVPPFVSALPDHATRGLADAVAPLG
jgi:dihydrodipicolinate synthase/N-acetylneuraminate lyase